MAFGQYILEMEVLVTEALHNTADCSISVARIFDWGGGANNKSNAMTSSETSKNEFFVGAKIS